MMSGRQKKKNIIITSHRVQVEIRYSQLIFAKTATSVGKKLQQTLSISFLTMLSLLPIEYWE